MPTLANQMFMFFVVGKQVIDDATGLVEHIRSIVFPKRANTAKEATDEKQEKDKEVKDDTKDDEDKRKTAKG